MVSDRTSSVPSVRLPAKLPPPPPMVSVALSVNTVELLVTVVPATPSSRAMVWSKPARLRLAPDTDRLTLELLSSTSAAPASMRPWVMVVAPL